MTHRILSVTLLVMQPVLAISAEPKHISQTAALELVTQKVAPEYPPMARQLHLTGTVEVDVVVGENGAVESATPASGNPVLTRPAADALKKWKFRPLKDGGEATRFEAVIKVSFSN